MDDNINNLFGFYREAGTCPSVSLTEKGLFSMVNGKNNAWPQMIFDIKTSENPARALEQALSEAISKNLPGFALCKADLFDAQALDYLRGSGIYPVKTWTLMEFLPSLETIFCPDKSGEIRELNGTDEISDFRNLVNEGLGYQIKIDADLLVEMSSRPALTFYGMFDSGELISTLLTFSDKKTTGLYFIVTKPQYRGRGLGANLIRHVIDLRLKKTEKVVLQAVQKALPLYTRLGFLTQGKLIIFWKR